MQKIDQLGLFWLAGHEDGRESGRLEFDPKDGGIRLTIVGELEGVPRSGDGPDLRIIGWIGNKMVTLDRCFSLGTSIPAPGVAESKFYANQMFLEHHIVEEKIRFQSVLFRLSDMDNWVGKSGINVKWRERDAPPDEPYYAATFSPLEQEVREFSRGRILLGHSWKQDGNSLYSAGISQQAYFKIEYNELQEFETIREDVSRVQNLVTLCIDAPTILDELKLYRPDVRIRVLSGLETRYEQPVEYLASQLSYKDPADRKARQHHMMLLSYDDLGGIGAVARWLDTAPRFQRALSSLMSIQHREQMYSENRFLNVTFAAEAFHRLTQNAAYMSQSEFDQILEVYLAQTPEEHHEWLRHKIEHGNEPPLGKRMRQLASRAGPATKPLIGNKDHWSFVIAQVRNELTHLASDSKEFSGSDLRYLTDSVYSVVRVCMLLESGVSADALSGKAEAYSQTWYKQRLVEVVQRIRQSYLPPKRENEPSK